MIITFVLLGVLLRVCDCGRVQTTGEECQLPMQVNSQIYNDCVVLQGVEWCQNANGGWGICKACEDCSGGIPLAVPQQTTQSLIPTTTEDEPKLRPQTNQTDQGGFRVGSANSDVVINEVLASDPMGSKDWVELYNKGKKPVNLTGWILTDSRVEEEQEPLVIGQGLCGRPEVVTIHPGGFMKYTKGAQCGFSFGLGEDDIVSLYAPEDNETAVDFMRWGLEEILGGASFARYYDGTDTLVYGRPTPGMPNQPASTSYLNQLRKGGFNSCCQRLLDLKFESNLPVMIIDIGSNVVVDEPKVSGVDMCTCSDFKDYDGTVGLELHGSLLSQTQPKKSYAFELRDENDKDVDFPLLGLPSEEDWVLYGPTTDRTMGLRNYLAYDFSRRTGQYASRVQYLELFYIDDQQPLSLNHYVGLYMLLERPKRNSKRVPIQELRPVEDDTGGYIWKHDNDQVEENDKVFHTSKSDLDMIMVYPNSRTVTPDNLDYLTRYVNQFEAALLSPEFADPKFGYRRFIDEDSFIDFLLIQELAKNPNGFRGNTFMHKDKGGKLRMGPVWDFKDAFGACCGYPIEGYQNRGMSNGISGGSAISPNGWRFQICLEQVRCIIDPQDGVSQWYRRMWQDEVFKNNAAKRWGQLRNDTLTDDYILSTIASVQGLVMNATIRNYQRWSNELSSDFFSSDKELWENEIQLLQNWLVDHIAWLDNEFTKLLT